MNRRPGPIALRMLAALLAFAALPSAGNAATGKIGPVAPVRTTVRSIEIGRVAPLTAQVRGPAPTGVSLTPGLMVAPRLTTLGRIGAAPIAVDVSAVSPTALDPLAVRRADQSSVQNQSSAAGAVSRGMDLAPTEAVVARETIGALERASLRLRAPGRQGDSSTTLDALFDRAPRRGATDVAALGSRPAGARLAAAKSQALQAPADSPRVSRVVSEPAAPKTSWKRTVSFGFLGATAALGVNYIVDTTAKLAGYVFNSNYAGVPEAFMRADLVSALSLLVMLAVLAPVSEEIFFRAGIQRVLSRITSSIRLGAFWVSAVIGALIFTAVHETSDPVLFAMRFVGAMIFAYVYKKEGLLASMSMHAAYNGIQVVDYLIMVAAGSLPLSAAVAGLLAFAGHLALGIAVVIGIVMSILLLRAQAAAAKSGDVTSKPFTPLHGLLAFAVLAWGFLFLFPNAFYLPALVGLPFWIYHTLSSAAAKRRAAL